MDSERTKEELLEELTSLRRELRQAHRALSESETKYRVIVEQIPAVIYAFAADEAATRSYVSPQVEEFLGIPAQEWLTDPELWIKRLHPDDADRVLGLWTEARLSGKPIDTKLRMLNAQGTPRWYHASSKAIRDETGKPVSYHGVLIDITERKQAETELLDQGQRLRLMADALPMCISYVDSEQRYQFNNATYEEWFGVAPEATKGKHVREVLGEAAYEIMRPTIESALAGQQLSHEADLPFTRGGPRYVRSMFVPHIGPGGTTAGFYALVADITQEKKNADALGRSERLASVGTFAAGIAHEINNPLGGILMAAETALANGGDPSAMEKALQEILRNTERCSRVVRSILTFAHEGKSEKIAADLNDVVQHARDLIHTYAEELGSTVELALAESPPKVVMNPTEMGLVILNLIRNAAQAGARNVLLRTQATPTSILLAVQDDGCGVTPEQKAHIFEPFYTTREQQGGTGLGLSIAHGIVTNHRATFDIESTPGEGTTITIQLPLSNDES